MRAQPSASPFAVVAIMAILTPEEYDCRALTELEAAAAPSDSTEKKHRLNQASAQATPAELAREGRDPPEHLRS
jgi:hypothetical protein